MSGLVLLGATSTGETPTTPTTPAPPPPVVVSPWQGIRSTLTSWDGSRWTISDPRSGVFLMREDILGLGLPPVERRRSSSAAESGSRFRSHRVSERPVVLPIYLYSDAGSEEWLARDAAFWRAMHPDRECVWTVTVPGYGSRHLRMRYNGDDVGYGHDPVKFGWAKYPMELLNESGFWEGEPVTQTWEPAAPKPFFGGDTGGGATPFYISRSATIGNAVMNNPGDVEAYAVWTVEGLPVDGIDSVTVGVGGRLTTADFPIAAGSSLTIDPRPGPKGKSAYDSEGVRRTAELSARDFAPIPAGQSVPLSLAMVGTGRVSATLVPRYYRAFG